jgi:ABC-type multidrug transport system fused ATPase/permease subunit
MNESSHLDPLDLYCGSNAIQVCTNSGTVSNWLNCLYHHHSRCRQNQNFASSLSDESGDDRQIEVEVILALVYLSIPIVLVIWAVHKMVSLHHESQHMKLYDDSLANPDTQQPQPPSIDLAFLKISFFVQVNLPSQLPQLRHLRSSRRARVLDQITGTFRAHQMSAIMGPSGSGTSDIAPTLSLSHPVREDNSLEAPRRSDVRRRVLRHPIHQFRSALLYRL